MKSYNDYMDAITADELFEGLLGHGMFAEKLPPVFTSEEFYKLCMMGKVSLDKKHHKYVYYENMRNINTPRQLAIPHPVAYFRQCEKLRDNWPKIKEHFKEKTKYNYYKKSRIHVRKLLGKKSLFQMNYDNWFYDGNPEVLLVLGKRYIVKADISNCFPSIYTHALVWALIGKEQAKKKKGINDWYNDIDRFTSNTTNNETHGLLIGPHASNILSEIILTAVDSELNRYCYTRSIDDYTCYVESYEEAQRFLTDLGSALRGYDLSLNHKKTSIIELPTAATEHWIRKLNSLPLETPYGKTDFILARAYLDYAIEIMQRNGKNAAILNYAIKTLMGRKLTKNAKEYAVRKVLSIVVLYPYLVTILDKHVFSVCCKECPTCDFIRDFANIIYNNGFDTRNYEQSSYALFFAIKYNFELENIDYNKVIDAKDCILLTLSFLYAHNHRDDKSIALLKDCALSLKVDEETFDEYWLFLYEILDYHDLPEDWKCLKKNNISFIKKTCEW